MWCKTHEHEVAPHEAVGWLWLEWLPVGGENDNVLGEVAVEVILGETDCRDQCAQIRVKRGGGDGEVSRCVAISMPWRKTNAVQEAGCCHLLAVFIVVDRGWLWSHGRRR